MNSIFHSRKRKKIDAEEVNWSKGRFWLNHDVDVYSYEFSNSISVLIHYFIFFIALDESDDKEGSQQPVVVLPTDKVKPADKKPKKEQDEEETEEESDEEKETEKKPKQEKVPVGLPVETGPAQSN